MIRAGSSSFSTGIVDEALKSIPIKATELRKVFISDRFPYTPKFFGVTFAKAKGGFIFELFFIGKGYLSE
ncbi:MAG: hypothetical protein COU71_02115 [Parcubacteria group bacterium CG10_big_fil_rev_8_21_14_0_10_38_31]|nr:MAG: hypothetical protein COU71_02115 [Parcubacteria group bacterium CG10_big_fil_rev_8_21_14_0_10_38_31]